MKKSKLDQEAEMILAMTDKEKYDMMGFSLVISSWGDIVQEHAVKVLEAMEKALRNSMHTEAMNGEFYEVAEIDKNGDIFISTVPVSQIDLVFARLRTPFFYAFAIFKHFNIFTDQDWVSTDSLSETDIKDVLVVAHVGDDFEHVNIVEDLYVSFTHKPYIEEGLSPMVKKWINEVYAK